ncbi:hypothetical protein ACOMHN_042302 [Nucella lapillus]
MADWGPSTNPVPSPDPRPSSDPRPSPYPRPSPDPRPSSDPRPSTDPVPCTDTRPMLGHRPSTDPVPGPDLGPSLTQQEIQPSEKAVSSKVAAATVADVTDHNRLETVTHDNKDKDHDGPPDSPSDDVQHSPSMDPDGGDAAVSTSVETPDIPTSTGSILAPSDVNGVDPQPMHVMYRDGISLGN